MIQSPKIVAIDDDPMYLNGLAEGFNELRFPCHQILFKADDDKELEPLKHVRFVFTDLHLASGAGSSENHYSKIFSLLDELITEDNGPYLLFLWTLYEEEAPDLAEFLKRLPPKKQPIQVESIRKKDFYEGNNLNSQALTDQLKASVATNQQLAALLDWERRASLAAGATIASIDDLIADEHRTPEHYSIKLRNLLGLLAKEAVGLPNVEGDRLGAINAALSPILIDRLAHLPDDSGLWENAYVGSGPVPWDSQEDQEKSKARLNSMIHLDVTTHVKVNDRGAVLSLEWDDDKLEEEFGCQRSDLFTELKIKADYVANAKLVLLQIEAACDYQGGNTKQVYAPYILGALVEAGGITNSGKRSTNILSLPRMLIQDKVLECVLNAHYLTRILTIKLEGAQVLFRLRDQILNEKSHTIGQHLSRPGFYYF